MGIQILKSELGLVPEENKGISKYSLFPSIALLAFFKKTSS